MTREVLEHWFEVNDEGAGTRGALRKSQTGGPRADVPSLLLPSLLHLPFLFLLPFTFSFHHGLPVRRLSSQPLSSLESADGTLSGTDESSPSPLFASHFQVASVAEKGKEVGHKVGDFVDAKVNQVQVSLLVSLVSTGGFPALRSTVVPLPLPRPAPASSLTRSLAAHFGRTPPFPPGRVPTFTPGPSLSLFVC